MESTGAKRPEALEGIPADRVVELDVRDDLRNGREPFQRIMAAKESLPGGGALMLRAIFEPAPLYGVLGRQGFEHWTEARGPEDWVVWFWKPTASPAGGTGTAVNTVDAGSGATGEADDEVVVLDVRGLDPPEPMVRTLAALRDMPRDHTLVQINVREPKFLLPKLEEAGFAYEVRRQSDDLVRVFIRHAERSGPPPEQSSEEPAGARRVERTLDVRVIPPREKHPAIFETFGALEEGESFVLVNDHDPKPLRYQFEAEHPGEYGWTYLEQGPTVWRVEISRSAR